MDGFSAKSVSALLTEHGIRTSKSKGQNFLIDGNIPEKIVRLAGFGGNDGVLEIGAGLGILTLALSRAAGRVVSAELDARLLPILDNILADANNVDLVPGDILKMDIKKLVYEKMPGLKHHVCANLPYNITTPILTGLINAGIFETITVMIQNEVAQRVCAQPGAAAYGAFSIFVKYHAEPETLFIVPPECFMPRPGVYSAVVKLSMRKERILAHDEEAMFFRVVRAAFAQRRKTLVNALYAAFGATHQKEAITALVRKCGFDERIRGEMLGVEDFIKLSEFIA